MKLHNYFRSSASFRVRIALNFKGLPYEYIPVHLLKEGGEQLAPAFRALSPEALVPVLDDDGNVVTQSLAIIEYLDETHPVPPLLPSQPLDRAYVRSIALAVACEIHPLNNLRVLRYLVRTLGVSEAQKNAWYRHWVSRDWRQSRPGWSRSGAADASCSATK
jgi:maleylacetoacetate isomerase